jgi:hypothetical protein
MSLAPPPAGQPNLAARRFVYVPAIGPRLKVLLAVIFAGVALLGATGAYLAAISLLNWLRQPHSYTTAFTLWTFLVHSAFGVVFLSPSSSSAASTWRPAAPDRTASRSGWGCGCSRWAFWSA